LGDAQAAAERELAAGRSGIELQIELHVELARIHDRFGLHRHTRPVAAALWHLEAASALAPRATPLARAQVELAHAEYHYQAEMPKREFAETTRRARSALDQFRELQSAHGEADALHKLGLVHFHRGELDQARILFEESRERDRAGGARPLFQADYERHVGFVLTGSGEGAAAIPYFERSLDLRRQAGAVDAAMFAATSLAQALVDSGRLDEAKSHLLYALLAAQRLDSGTGNAQVGLLLARMYERRGDTATARLAAENALRAAESIGHASITRQTRELLERLQEPRGR
jgi:tetratricopeptide (TPR) repeat protein